MTKVTFNQVTLAKKQLTEKMSRKPVVLSEIEKVKYLPNVEVVETTMTSKAVFTWRNFWPEEPYKFFTESFKFDEDVPVWFIYRHTRNGKYYIVNTSGYDYMRYIAEVEDY